MSDLLTGGIVGALLICAVFAAAHKFGLMHISLGRDGQHSSAAPEPRRAYPRIDSTITVEPKNELNSELRPQVRLFATVENGGEVTIRSLIGFWKVVTPDKAKHPSIPIRRELLEPRGKYFESYLLDEGIDTHGAAIRFDVEIDFHYMAESDLENRHYSAKYRYDQRGHRMIKL